MWQLIRKILYGWLIDWIKEHKPATEEKTVTAEKSGRRERRKKRRERRR